MVANCERNKRAGEAGERPADDERGEHPAPARHAGELGGARVGADGVEVAPRPQRAHAVPGHEHHDEHEDREPRHHATDGLVPDALVGARDRRRVDLLAADEACVDAADDVEHRQGHHQARDAEDGGDESVDRADRRADDDAEGERDQDRRAGMVAEEHADRVGGQSEHRPERQVDVAGDDHHRLADAEEGDERGPGEQLLDARLVGEVRVLDRGQPEHDEQGEHEAGLAGTQQQLGAVHPRRGASEWKRGGQRRSPPGLPSCRCERRGASGGAADARLMRGRGTPAARQARLPGRWLPA